MYKDIYPWLISIFLGFFAYREAGPAIAFAIFVLFFKIFDDRKKNTELSQRISKLKAKIDRVENDFELHDTHFPDKE